MALEKTQPGRPFTPHAEDWNAFVDAALAHRDQAFNAAGQPTASRAAANTILVQNASGDDLPRFGVLGLSAPVIDPTASAQEFFARVAFVGVEPTAEHARRFCVAAQPIPAGELGRAYVLGCAAVEVDVRNEAHGYAAVEAERVTNLISAPWGPLEILWKASGTGTRAAVVRWATPADALVDVKVRSDGGVAGDATTQCSWTYAIYSADTPDADITGETATPLATGLTPSLARTALGKYFAAPAASWGLARYVDGAWELRVAWGEYPDYGGCVPDEE